MPAALTLAEPMGVAVLEPLRVAKKLTLPVGTPVVVEMTCAWRLTGVNCGMLLLVAESSDVVPAWAMVMVLLVGRHWLPA